MSTEQELELQLTELGEVMTASTDFTSGIMDRIDNRSVSPAKSSKTSVNGRSCWIRSCKLLAVVAVAALMVWLWPTNDQTDMAGNNWWLGSPAVYAGEIVDAIQQGQVEGVLFRSGTTFVLKDGSEENSPTTGTIAVVGDRYRYESSTAGRLGMVTWSVLENDEYVVTKYLAHDNSTRVRRMPREQGLGASPLARVLEISRLIEQANRHLDPKEIDGHESVGFEIDANKVHKKHKSGTYQIWLDTKTKLPVKMTFGRDLPSNPDHNNKRMISVSDRFEWNPKLADGTFEPKQNPQPLR